MLDGATENIPVPPLSSDAPGQQLPLAPPPGESSKRKRHRRTKAELEAARKGETGEQPPATDANEIKEATAALSVTFQAIGTILAAKRGDHWKLKQEECDVLGGAWANVLAPYLAKYGKSVPVIGALVITWSVAQSRITEDQRIKKLKADLKISDAPPAPAPALP
jgi:hypothetical protein